MKNKQRHNPYFVDKESSSGPYRGLPQSASLLSVLAHPAAVMLVRFSPWFGSQRHLGVPLHRIEYTVLQQLTRITSLKLRSPRRLRLPIKAAADNAEQSANPCSNFVLMTTLTRVVPSQTVPANSMKTSLQGVRDYFT